MNFFFILWCALRKSKNYRHVLWGDGLFLQNGMKNIPCGVSGTGMQKCWSSAFVICLHPFLYKRGMHPLLQLIFMIPIVGEGISSYLFLAWGSLELTVQIRSSVYKSFSKAFLNPLLSALYPTTEMEKFSYASSCVHPPPLQSSLLLHAQLPCVELHIRVWMV